MGRILLGVLLILNIYFCFLFNQMLKFDTSVNKILDLFVQDNIKNVVKYGGKTYFIYGVKEFGYVRDKHPVVHPVYMEESHYDQLLDEWRGLTWPEKAWEKK